MPSLTPVAKDYPMRLCPRSRSAPGPFETYLHEIDQTPLLTAEEERELACAVQEGDAEARDHLVRANLRLVVRIARDYQGIGMAMEDLIAEGNLGLMRAAEGFDPEMGTRFSTYASYWIKASIKRGVLNAGKTVRVPAYMTQLLTEWRRTSARLQEELGREPADDEIALSLGLGKKRLGLIKKAIRVHNAGLETEQGGAGTSLQGLLGDDRAARPDARALAAEEMREVLDLLGRLDPREATVLRMRFGLGGDDPLALEKIGERLDLTRERVRQIEQKALCNLRELLSAD
jgi:RNA polymerase primary sigma factor